MKKLFSIMIILVMIISMSTIVFATDETVDEPTEETSTEISDNVKKAIDKTWDDSDDLYLNGGIKEVTLAEASSKFERKLYDVVDFLQTIVQPFAIVIFILGGLMVMVGHMGNHSFAGKGYIVMFFSGVMYVAILFSPEILNFVLVWWAS